MWSLSQSPDHHRRKARKETNYVTTPNRLVNLEVYVFILGSSEGALISSFLFLDLLHKLTGSGGDRAGNSNVYDGEIASRFVVGKTRKFGGQKLRKLALKTNKNHWIIFRNRLLTLGKLSQKKRKYYFKFNLDVDLS